MERPDVRANLLDAAEALIRSEGYGAATARRIADAVGMKHQAIFYYFGSQDELLLGVFGRSAAAHRDRLVAAKDAKYPIRTLWDIHCDPDSTRLTLEFMALANHNDFIRTEIAKQAEDVRKLETEIIENHLRERGIFPRLSPQYVAMLTAAMARMLVQEATLGIHIGHDEATAIVEAGFRQFELTGDDSSPLDPLVQFANAKPEASNVNDGLK